MIEPKPAVAPNPERDPGMKTGLATNHPIHPLAA